MEIELTETAVTAALVTRWVGRPYLYRSVLDSTNTTLKQMARDDADKPLPAGTVLLADYQRRGRGRLRRRWLAPPGSALLFSVLLRPGWPPPRAGWLTMIGALAVTEAIRSQTGLAAAVKWPNDIMLPAAASYQKTAGLLLEAEIAPDGRLAQAVLGIGVNVNIPAAQLPDTVPAATSLLVAGGRSLSRRPLLAAILQQLEAHYDAAVAGHSPHADWEQRLITLGQTVQVTPAAGGAILVGRAVGTDPLGQLLVQDSEGRQHRVAAGDVTLQPV